MPAHVTLIRFQGGRNYDYSHLQTRAWRGSERLNQLPRVTQLEKCQRQESDLGLFAFRVYFFIFMRDECVMSSRSVSL